MYQQQPPQIQMQSPSPNGLLAGGGPPPESYGYMMQQNVSRVSFPSKLSFSLSLPFRVARHLSLFRSRSSFLTRLPLSY